MEHGGFALHISLIELSRKKVDAHGLLSVLMSERQWRKILVTQAAHPREGNGSMQ